MSPIRRFLEALHSASDDKGSEVDELFGLCIEEILSPALTEEDLRSIRVLLGDAAYKDSEPPYLSYLKALDFLARTRTRAIEGALPDNRHFLLTELNERSNAERVLRALASGVNRPKNLLESLGIFDTQLHRVMKWAKSRALVSKSKQGGKARYQLTNLGRELLESVDEPPWLPIAAVLIRLGLQSVVLGRAPEQIAKLAESITGLPRHQAEHCAAVVLECLDPSLTSYLAQVLRGPGADFPHVVVCPVVYPRELKEELLLKDRNGESYSKSPWVRREGIYAPRLDALAETYIYRSLERAGLQSELIEESMPLNWAKRCASSRDPVVLPRNKSFISLSSPLVSPVSLNLLLRYGSPVYFDYNVRNSIQWEGLENGRGGYFGLTEEVDHAFVIRFFDSTTSLSHFILAGLKPSGTYAACRFFYENIEGLLERFPCTSFATIIRVRRGYGRRKGALDGVEVAIAPQEIESVGPEPLECPLDMRFIDFLPLLADIYLAKQDRRGWLKQKLLAIPNQERFKINGEIKGLLSTHAPTYRIARDLFVVLSRAQNIDDLIITIAVDHIYNIRSASTVRHRSSKPTVDELLKMLPVVDFTRQALHSLIKRSGREPAFIDACIEGPQSESFKHILEAEA